MSQNVENIIWRLADLEAKITSLENAKERLWKENIPRGKFKKEFDELIVRLLNHRQFALNELINQANK